MGRVTATVLFTDLVGSTDLRAQVGEGAADELIGRHDRALTEAVEAHEGQVVKGLGDGIMATFAGAADAVAAAVAIQQAADRLNRTGKIPAALSVRVGLSAGDVAIDDDVHGTPVIEAARLCTAAAGGEILASEVVRWLGGTQGASSLTPVGSLDLKGLAAPVPAVRVEWDPAPNSPIPLPALLTGAGRIFVGRDGELERLSRLWKEAVAGERRLALVAGEPGIGKTRLAAMAARAFHEGGGVVLAGRCDEDLGVPYQPFVEALRHYVIHAGEPRLGRHGGELVRLVPEVAEVASGLAPPLRSDPETERYRLFDAVAAWLADVSAEAPVLLVLDDLQWAAKPTLLLLRHVLRSPEAMSLLVVVTYRDSDVGRGHPLSDFLADLRREQGVERLSLVGLDVPGVADYLIQASGHGLDDAAEELARAVWRETEGVPFFVAEVMRHLTESGGVEQQDGRWVVTAAIDDLGIPEGVRDVVGRRLSRLSEDANQVLACASVAGLEFEPAVVAAAGSFPEDTVLAALEEAVAARLLVDILGPVPRNRFAHALVRATLYDELTKARRVALHRKVAAAIEALHARALDDYLPALSHHWARASAPAADTARAVAYARRAGDRALAQLAYDEAVTYYRQALELLEIAGSPRDDRLRCDLLLALGEAQNRAGQHPYRETLLEVARLAQERGDADTLASAALANTRRVLLASFGTVDTERVEVLEAALSAVAGRGDAVEARLGASLGLELGLAGDRERRRALSDAALALAGRLNDPATEVHVLLARHHTIAGPDTLHERQDNTVQLTRACEALGDPVATCRACYPRVRLAMEQGKLTEAGSILDTWEAIARELGQPTLRWNATFARAAWSMSIGALRDAEGLITESARLGAESGQPDAVLLHAALLYGIRFEQGRLTEIRQPLEQAMAGNPAASSLPPITAMLYCQIGELDLARARLEDCNDFSVVPANVYWSITMASWAVVVATLGDRARARDLYPLVAPYPDQIAGTGVWWIGSIAHFLGMLATTIGDFDEAEARFASAHELACRSGAPTWLARTRLEWARMLLTRHGLGDVERARDLLDQALASARELGLANVERRAVELVEQA